MPRKKHRLVKKLKKRESSRQTVALEPEFKPIELIALPVEPTKKVERDKAAMIKFTPTLTIGNGASKLKDTVRRLLSEGKNRILIDLSSIERMDSSGQAEIVSSHLAAKEEGGYIVIVNATQKVTDELSYTRMLTELDTTDLDRAQLDLKYDIEYTEQIDCSVRRPANLP